MPFLETGELRRRLQRHADWFHGQLSDGPLLKLEVRPDPPATPVEPPPAHDQRELEAWWCDPARVIPRVEAGLGDATYLGDAYPHHFVNLGPGALAAFMGCRSVPMPQTIWQEPLIEDWSQAPPLVLQEDNPYWQAAQALTRESLAASGGRWMVSLTDIGGTLDITSYFRTPEVLCMDLVEHPDEVQRCEKAVLDAWFRVYDRLYEPISAEAGGACGWMGMWYPGRTYPLQCDFSCMISPEMFREFAFPWLRRTADRLDVAIYHLDGPGAIRHLDAICEISTVRGIQWVPGAGGTHAVADWLDLYRRILDHDRGIWMTCREDELELVFDRLDPDRLVLPMVARTPAEGERILAKVERLRRGRKRVQ